MSSSAEKRSVKYTNPSSDVVPGGCSYIAEVVIDHGVWQQHAVTDTNNIIRDSAACTTAMGGSHE